MRWRELLHLNETNPLPANFLASPRRVHFIGIGGIGMSALALLLNARGHQVSGSDASESAMLAKLREAGITCFVGQKAENLGETGAVFYSSAIAEDNPEFAGAKAAGVPCWHRSQLLADVANRAKMSIAVTGTHGKSTTSAMVAHILTERGHNPTAVLGAVYPPFDSNVRIGDPDLVVVEADESDGSFTLLKPAIGVVLNVEPEHLENYDESEAELWKAFKAFAAQSEVTILNADTRELLRELDSGSAGYTYGLSADDASFNARDIRTKAGKTYFTLKTGHGDNGLTSLIVPGRHNISNALAAMLASWLAGEGIGAEYISNVAGTLATFAGTLRRFEKKGEANGVIFYDDYGHHPTEVKATLEAAKEFLERPVFVIFQPHRYSRTLHLGKDFGGSFGAADKIIITQLYSAFEEPIPGVSGRIVFDAVRESFPEKTVLYAETLDEARQLALENLASGDALLTMGAGDITKLGPVLMKEWETYHAR